MLTATSITDRNLILTTTTHTSVHTHTYIHTCDAVSIDKISSNAFATLFDTIFNKTQKRENERQET